MVPWVLVPIPWVLEPILQVLEPVPWVLEPNTLSSGTYTLSSGTYTLSSETYTLSSGTSLVTCLQVLCGSRLHDSSGLSWTRVCVFSWHVSSPSLNPQPAGPHRVTGTYILEQYSTGNIIEQNSTGNILERTGNISSNLSAIKPIVH